MASLPTHVVRGRTREHARPDSPHNTRRRPIAETEVAAAGTSNGLGKAARVSSADGQGLCHVGRKTGASCPEKECVFETCLCRTSCGCACEPAVDDGGTCQALRNKSLLRETCRPSPSIMHSVGGTERTNAFGTVARVVGCAVCAASVLICRRARPQAHRADAACSENTHSCVMYQCLRIHPARAQTADCESTKPLPGSFVRTAGHGEFYAGSGLEHF